MMAHMGRGNQDWDPMRDDFDNSNYDPQNPEDSSSNFVNLDHCRLYITNIPRALNEDGLFSAFSKYGRLDECFLSTDPDKRFGLVGFETPGEAKLAMMKLNRTDPLNMQVTIAKSKGKRQTGNSGNRGGNSNGPRNRDDRGFREDDTNFWSNSRKPDSMANGDSMDDMIENPVLNASLEPDLTLELEQLKCEELRIQEERVRCRRRMLLMQQEKKTTPSTRCILPDGRIVVRNAERDTRDADGSGDANIPALLSYGVCVTCGEHAEAFCSGCRVTPYCSAACQRRDWKERHKKVCHNLKRQSGSAAAPIGDPEPEPQMLPTVAPLRRPRSPGSAKREPVADRALPKKFGPPGNATSPLPGSSSPRHDNRSRNPRGNQPDNRGNQPDYRGNQQDNRGNQQDNRGNQQDNRGNQQDNRGKLNRSFEGDGDRSTGRPHDRDRCDRERNNRDNPRDRNNRDSDNRDSNNRDRNDYFVRKNVEYNNRSRNQDGDRQPPRQYGGRAGVPAEDEDWGPKPQAAKPVQPKSPQVPKEQPSFEAKAAPVKSAPAEAPPRPNAARPIASVADVAPTPRKLVPKNCIVEVLPMKDSFILSVDSTGSSCRGRPGWVCSIGVVTGEHADNYALLLDPLAQAAAAAEPADPRPGDTFAYLDKSDGCWYRARCVAPGLAALLDASRIAPCLPADCKRLPEAFADIPEYCCHLDCDRVKLSDTLNCTVLSKSGGAMTVSVSNAETDADLGTATVSRWLPEVEAPRATAPSVVAPTTRCVVAPTTRSVVAPTTSSAATAPVAPTTSSAATAPVAPTTSSAATAPVAPTTSSAATAPVAPTTSSAPAASTELPQVPRPPVSSNSTVVLLDATEPTRVFVRPAARDKKSQFDDLLCEVAMYGADESTPRLKELPATGQIVVAQFTDDIHYRALVKRVSSKKRKVLVELIEYGNAMIVDKLETLLPCPPQFDITARPTLTSMVSLPIKPKSFSDAATAYIDKLKDDDAELTLTIPSGANSGPTGTPVRLTVVKSGEDVNRTVEALSTPEWQKLLDRGGDVLETEKLYFKDIEYVDPPSSCEMVILEISVLENGIVYGYARNAPHAERAFALAPRLDEYCNSALGRDPYLPMPEELCIAKCPNKNQWLRAVMLEQTGGPGGQEAPVLFYDYGSLADLPVTSLRKMMPEFARGIPAVTCSLEIKDFPKPPSPEQLERAKRHMQITEAGTGYLKVTSCRRLEVGEYLVEAPELIRALM